MTTATVQQGFDRESIRSPANPRDIARSAHLRAKSLPANGVVSYGQISEHFHARPTACRSALRPPCGSGTRIVWQRVAFALPLSRPALSYFLEGLFHAAHPNESSLRRCLQCVCRSLRLLLVLMPAGDARTPDGPMHCPRHGLRCDLPGRRRLHVPQKRVHGAGLQAVRRDLQGMR